MPSGLRGSPLYAYFVHLPRQPSCRTQRTDHLITAVAAFQVQSQVAKRHHNVSRRSSSVSSPAPRSKKKDKGDTFTTTEVQLLSVYTADMELTGKINEAFAEKDLAKAVGQVKMLLETIQAMPPDKERANTANFLRQELKKMRADLQKYESTHKEMLQKEQARAQKRKAQRKLRAQGKVVSRGDPRLQKLSISHHHVVEIHPMKFEPLPKSRTAAQEMMEKRKAVEKELRLHSESGGTDELLIELNNDAMYWACYKQDYAEVDRTLSLKADPNHIPKQGTNGQTALFWAVSRSNKPIADLLVKYGADVNGLSTPWGYSPLHIAASNGDMKCINMLVKHGANVDLLVKGHDAALRAFLQGHDEVALQLLKMTGQQPGYLFDTWTSARTEEARKELEEKERIEREALEKEQAAEEEKRLAEEEAERRLREEQQSNMEEEMEGAAWYKELLKPKAGHDSKAMMQASDAADLTHAPFHGRLPGDISEPGRDLT